MHLHHFAQVKAALRAQIAAQRGLIRNRRHAGIAFGTLQIGNKGAELALQAAFGVLQHAPDLFLPYRVLLAQHAQVAVHQAFHLFFDLVGAQVFGQQGHALALFLAIPEGQA